jgi:hypothetical protein
MGHVTIQFHGVCVHVRRTQEVNLPEDVEHRVVLIDARNGRNANGHTIAPHIATVQIYGQSPEQGGIPLISRELDRQHLWIDGAAEGMPAVHDVFHCAVPSLRGRIADLVIDSSVVVDGVGAAGLFDLSGGTITAEIRHQGAGVAIFQSPVSDDATLQIQPHGGGPTESIPLPGTAWIIVSNVGDSGEDSDADFLLNYLVSGTIPPNAPILNGPLACPLSLRKVAPPFSIGPGCSNTQYP